MKISNFAKRFLIMIMCGFLFTGSLAVPVMADEAELTDALGVTPDTDGDINASDQGNIHEDAQKNVSGSAEGTDLEVNAWSQLQEDINEGGTVVLTQDIIASDSDTALTVPSGKSVVLYLNRHTINRSLSGAVENGSVIINNGDLTITGGGKITGGYTTGNGGGVLNNGSLTIETAAVSGNAANGNGGGVYSGGSSKLYIQGTPIITGNTAGEKEGNLYITSNVMVEAKGKLTENAKIGISAEGSLPRLFTRKLDENGSPSVFTSEREGAEVRGFSYYGTQAALYQANRLNINIRGEGEVQTDREYYINGDTVNATVKAADKWEVESVKFGYTPLTLDESGACTFTFANNSSLNVAFKMQPAEYIDSDGSKKLCEKPAVITEGMTSLDKEWYYIYKNDDINAILNVPSDTNIILADGVSVSVKGITVDQGATLTIYGQEKQSGALYAQHEQYTYESDAYGIGGQGNVIINGGRIYASGGRDYPGIGALNSSYGNHVTINRGRVESAGGSNCPGILAGTVSVNGGEVVATGTNIAGIGGSSVTISGGHVEAQGYADDFFTVLPGIRSSGNITLTYGNDPDISIRSTGYQAYGKVTLAKPFKDSSDGTVFPAQDYTDAGQMKDKTLVPANAYKVTKADIWAGSINTDKATAVAGATVTLSYSPGIGYEFKEWKITDAQGNNVPVSENRFTMPESDVTADVVCRPLPPIDYVDENGKAQPETSDYIIVQPNKATWKSGLYAVTESFDINERITVDGDVALILCDGAALNAKAGITVKEGNSLTVYQQSGGGGKLIATAAGQHFAGIGGDDKNGAGTITINGGDITANGNFFGAGIGNANVGNGGYITFNNGIVNATGGLGAAGIGGGFSRNAVVTINGGTVTSTGGQYGAGIGGGDSRNAGKITITGGRIKATGGSGAAGIGGGRQMMVSGGRILISGGHIEASSIGNRFDMFGATDYNTFTYNKASDDMSIKSNSYSVPVTLEKDFIDNKGNVHKAGTYPAGTFNGLTLTPYEEDEKVSLNVSVVWDTFGLERPVPKEAEVVLQKKEGASWNTVETLTLNNGLEWTGAFENISKHELEKGNYRIRELDRNGHVIYTEEDADGPHYVVNVLRYNNTIYSVVYTSDNNGNVTITNSLEENEDGGEADYEFIKITKTWKKGSGKDAEFTVDRSWDEVTFRRFTGILMDGVAVAESDYDKKEGSVIITLKADYLERLALGEHTLTAEFTDGEASAEFTIVAVGSSGSATQKTNSAVTGDSRNTGVRKTYGVRSGDESNTGAMLVLIFASLAFIAAVLIRYKKSRKKY